MRLDKKLVTLNFFETRTKAQEEIKNGHVLVNEMIVTKPSYLITDEDKIKIKEGHKVFVGRGAHKLEGALKNFEMSLGHKVILDVGASTGGFTEICLREGASKVFAIDVGTNQLAKKLLEDDRVINLEGTNIRDSFVLDDFGDIAVVDLSFISLSLVIENIFRLLNDKGEVIALFKPQFEVGKDYIGKNGIVKNKEAVFNSLKRFISICNDKQIFLDSFSHCEIKGKKGNQEYFLLLKKNITKNKLEITGELL